MDLVSSYLCGRHALAKLCAVESESALSRRMSEMRLYGLENAVTTLAAQFWRTEAVLLLRMHQLGAVREL